MGIHRKFKIGVLYCRSGQKTEEDMYNNENSGPAFSEFLEVLGQRVRLKNFDKYRGGLDKKSEFNTFSSNLICSIKNVIFFLFSFII